MNLLVLLIVGASFIVIFTYLYIKSNEIKKNGIRVKGIIIDIISSEPEAFEDNIVTYKPIIEFKTQKGNVIKKKYYMRYSSKNKFKIGEKLEVIYNSKNPDEYIISKINNDLYILLFLCLGLIFVGIYLFN